MTKAAELVRREAAQLGGNVRATYQLALAILFLDRLGEYKDTDLIQYLALCLIAGQRADGGWIYQCPALDRASVPQLLERLGDPRSRSGTGTRPHSTANHSIHTAGTIQTRSSPSWGSGSRSAIRSPSTSPSSWRRNTSAQRNCTPSREPSLPTRITSTSTAVGTTAPGRNAGPWPSMTCSGLLGLAIGHGVAKDRRDKDQKPLDDPAIKAGLAMLAREIDRPGERRSPDHYFLWSVERVAVLYDLDRIDGKDWYGWGCRVLLPRQKNDGSWHDAAFYGNNVAVNTCFALLFLKRANLARDLTDKLQLLAHVTARDRD